MIHDVAPISRQQFLDYCVKNARLLERQIARRVCEFTTFWNSDAGRQPPHERYNEIDIFNSDPIFFNEDKKTLVCRYDRITKTQEDRVVDRAIAKHRDFGALGCSVKWAQAGDSVSVPPSVPPYGHYQYTLFGITPPKDPMQELHLKVCPEGEVHLPKSIIDKMPDEAFRKEMAYIFWRGVNVPFIEVRRTCRGLLEGMNTSKED